MTGAESLVWLSVNLKSGGMTVVPGDVLLRRHGSLDMRWLTRLPEIVRLAPHRPHVIFLQEAMWFDRYGDELLLYVERRLRAERLGTFRGFLTRSRRSPHHQAVFIDTAALEAAHHWRGVDPDEPSGLYGFVEVVVEGGDSLWVKSVHLDPRDDDARLAEAKNTHAVITPDQKAMVAGDFNSITSRRTAREGEPQRNFARMEPAERYGAGRWPATRPGGDTDPETRAMDYLLDTGWVDQHINDKNSTPTTMPGHDRGGELITDRCLTHGGLATVPGSVWVDTSTVPYSDHRAFGGAVRLIGSGGAW